MFLGRLPYCLASLALNLRMFVRFYPAHLGLSRCFEGRTVSHYLVSDMVIEIPMLLAPSNLILSPRNLSSNADKIPCHSQIL